MGTEYSCVDANSNNHCKFKLHCLPRSHGEDAVINKSNIRHSKTQTTITRLTTNTTAAAHDRPATTETNTKVQLLRNHFTVHKFDDLSHQNIEHQVTQWAARTASKLCACDILDANYWKPSVSMRIIKKEG